MTMRAATTRAVPLTPETSLIERARSMDADAWDELYNAHHSAIFRYAYVRTQNQSVAEDLAAEVFVQAVRSIRRYRHRGIAFRAWLYRIARNVTADYQRHRQRKPTVPLPANADEFSRAADFAGRVIDQRALLAALDHLTSEQREVVALRFLVGLSLTEVAAVTGRRSGAVKSMQRRALQRMRAILEEED